MVRSQPFSSLCTLGLRETVISLECQNPAHGAEMAINQDFRSTPEGLEPPIF